MSEFPAGFLWGCATSAYQIEGSPLADGAGPSVWHRFAHTPGMIVNDDTGDIACDHYRRWAEDVALMQRLGLKAYRFSVSWSRVLPNGRGAANAPGLDFYDRLVDALLEKGIEPLLTLFHWDLPAALDDRGGWLNPDIAHWFADYAAAMFRKLDGRVKKWTTINEPWVVSDGGYLFGPMAPGHRNLFEAPIAAHNLLRAHGAAVEAYRAEGRHEIGIVVNLEPKHAASHSDADIAATRRADAYMNRQYLDPLFRGAYPDEVAEIFGEAWPQWPEEDFKLIRQPIDFLGVNYYTRSVTRSAPALWPVRACAVRQPRVTYTDTNWEVFSAGLTEILVWIKSRYGDVPLYVMENGAAFRDPPAGPDGRIDDAPRVEYLRAHIGAVAAAIGQGVDVRGYMVWSLLDNFEWSQGYSKRFGIVRVDYATQARAPKASADFYAQVIASNGACLAASADMQPTT